MSEGIRAVSEEFKQLVLDDENIDEEVKGLMVLAYRYGRAERESEMLKKDINKLEVELWNHEKKERI